MKIYLDTGNLEEIKEAAKTGLIDGVTTNPSLIAKEKKDFKETIKEIIKILKENKIEDFTVSAEVTNLKSIETILKQARKLSKLDKHILVKIPLTKDGLSAVKILSKEKIKCNVTLCFSANQALMAAKSGAWCISPFMGRLDDIGDNGLKLIEEIREIYDKYNYKTNILAASTRSSLHVKESAKIGSDIITLPFKIFNQLFSHPLTDKGLKIFEKDWFEYEKHIRYNN